MQLVSNTYKTAMAQAFRNRSYVEVVLEIMDSTANTDAALSDSGHAVFSDVTAAIGVLRPSKLYATMEYNRFPVDGSQYILPDSGERAAQGYCSDVLSKDDCTFGTNPVVSINFSQLHNILGFTIVFDTTENLYCTDFTARIYNGTTLLNTFTITGNSKTEYMIDTPLNDFNKIEVEFVKTSQVHNRVHVFGFAFGLIKTFTNDQLMDGMTQDTAVNPISTELPTVQLDFSIDNYDGSYNPDNPASIYECLQQEQAVTLSYGYDTGNGIEWLKGGRYYLFDWNVPANKQTASFTAKSLLEFMQQTYTKGVYNPEGTTLYDLATTVLLDAGIPKGSDGANPWILDSSLKTIKTTAPLPPKTHRELLQLIANAGMCVLFVDRDGKINIAPALDEQTDYYLGLDNAAAYPENTLSTPLQEVDIKIYSFLQDTATSDICSGTFAIFGTQTIHIDFADSPAVNLTAAVTAGTLVSASYYTYSCDLIITASGSVAIALTGYKLTVSSSTISYVKNSSGEICPVDNPIITDATNAVNVSHWIADYLDLRRTYTEDYRGDPALDAGDIIAIQTQYTASLNARILESVIKFSDSLSGTLTLKGMS
jgi:hypothetical protein